MQMLISFLLTSVLHLWCSKEAKAADNDTLNATFPAYQTNATYLSSSTSVAVTDNLALQYWYSWEQSFMGFVQPLHLDAQFISKIFHNSGNLLQDKSKLLGLLQSPQLEGILIMIVIGLVYLVLITLVGILWCCYRCCCYKDHQRFDRTGYRTQRLLLSVCTFEHVIFLLSAAVMSYMAGSDLVGSAKGIDSVIHNAFLDIRVLVNETGNQIEFITRDGFASARFQMETKLNNTGKIMGTAVLDRLTQQGITDAIQGINNVAASSTEIAAMIKSITAKTSVLKNDLHNFIDQLAALKAKLTCSDPVCSLLANGCVNTPNVVSLSLFDTKAINDNIDVVTNGNFTGLAISGYQRLLSIPDTIDRKSANGLKNITKILNDFEADLDQYLEPIVDMTRPLQVMLADQAITIKSFMPTIAQYASYVNIAVIVIASIILFIGLFMFFGCACGAVYFDQSVLPTQRQGNVTFGNFFLMIAVFIMLLFTWIFMLITILFFVLGTQMDGTVCPVLKGAPNNFTLMDDVVDLLEETMHTGSMLTLYGNQSIQPGQMMLSCMHNASLYTTLGLKSVFDVDQIQSRMDSFNILGNMDRLKVNIGIVDVFDANTEQQVQNFQVALDPQPGFNAYIVDLDPSKPLMVGNLVNMRDDLQKSGLDQTTYIDTNLVLINALEDQIAKIDTNRFKAKTLLTTVADRLVKARAARIYMANNVTRVVTQVAISFINSVYSIAQQFVLYVINVVKNKAGACRPLYDAIESCSTWLCDGFLGPLNGFWFALGLALAVFIPALCCNCRLAKYYKRARTTDVASRRSTLTEHRHPSTKTTLKRSVRRKIRPSTENDEDIEEDV